MDSACCRGSTRHCSPFCLLEPECSGAKVNQRTEALQQEIKIRKQTEQELESYQERLKALASQLTLAEERERQRIAAELHDQVGQSLAFARMRLASAKKNTANEKLQDILNDVSASMLQAVQDTRHVIYDLSSPAMHDRSAGSYCRMAGRRGATAARTPDSVH